MAKQALGKGLGALIGAPKVTHTVVQTPEQLQGKGKGERVQEVALHSIFPSPLQPRKEFQEEELHDLAESIRSVGILQPLIVRPVGDRYELIAGERRWRAAQRTGLQHLPVVVREASDEEVLEWAMVENLQRADLNPMEEADGYEKLMQAFGLTQERVAQRVGKSRAAVANALRLRALPTEVQDLVRKTFLSVGHAKVILGLASHEEQVWAAQEIVRRALTVRQTEKLVTGMKPAAGRKQASRPGQQPLEAQWRELEQQLQQSLGTRVKLVGTGQRGTIQIEFYTSSDLERLLTQLGALESSP